MKCRLLVVSILVVFMTFLFSAVYAPLSTLGTGYAVTSNYEGVDVPLGAEVVITALTLDDSVDSVTFRWHEPPDGNGDVAREVTVPVVNSGETGEFNNGTEADIWVAEDSFSPDVLGDWGVQVFFQDAGTTRAGLEGVVCIKARSFNTVPEIPLGTIGTSVVIVVALALFVVKQKRKARAVNK